MWIDTHCHIAMEEFDHDRDAVIERARKAGVESMIVISTQSEDFPKVQACIGDHIYGTVGIHPHNVNDSKTCDQVKEALDHFPHWVGIGETGLDFSMDTCDQCARLAQEQSFLRHLSLAAEYNKSVVVHTRDADEQTLGCLQDFPHVTGVIHCFTRSYDFARRVLDQGWMISIPGIITFKNAKDLQATVARLPLDRLVVETDAPFLAPVPCRGKRNEPAFVAHTGEALACLLGRSVEEVAVATTRNARTLFGL